MTILVGNTFVRAIGRRLYPRSSPCTLVRLTHTFSVTPPSTSVVVASHGSAAQASNCHAISYTEDMQSSVLPLSRTSSYTREDYADRLRSPSILVPRYLSEHSILVLVLHSPPSEHCAFETRLPSSPRSMWSPPHWRLTKQRCFILATTTISRTPGL